MIKDVRCEALAAHHDDRGYLIEILRATDPWFTKFGQVYLVGDLTRGTIRAFHMHRILWDWFFISHGTAKFVLYDDRKDSPTWKQKDTFILGTRKPALLVIPPGVYHGYVALEDDTQLISTASEVYNRVKPDEEQAPYDSFETDWSIQFR